MQAMSGKQEFRGLKGLKKQRRIQVIALAAVAFAGRHGVGRALCHARRDQLFPLSVPGDDRPAARGARPSGSAGWWSRGSIKRGQGTEVGFAVTDTNATVPVRYTGVLPDLFGEGQGMIRAGADAGRHVRRDRSAGQA